MISYLQPENLHPNVIPVGSSLAQVMSLVQDLLPEKEIDPGTDDDDEDYGRAKNDQLLCHNAKISLEWSSLQVSETVSYQLPKNYQPVTDVSFSKCWQSARRNPGLTPPSEKSIFMMTKIVAPQEGLVATKKLKFDDEPAEPSFQSLDSKTDKCGNVAEINELDDEKTPQCSSQQDLFENPDHSPIDNDELSKNSIILSSNEFVVEKSRPECLTIDSDDDSENDCSIVCVERRREEHCSSSKPILLKHYDGFLAQNSNRVEQQAQSTQNETCWLNKQSISTLPQQSQAATKKRNKM